MMLPRTLCHLVLCLALADTVGARLLDRADWTVRDPDGLTIPQVADDDADTVWQAAGPQVTGQAVTIDLGRAHLLQRLVLNPGPALAGIPRSLVIAAGNDPAALQTCGALPADSLEPVKVIDLQPTVARYVRLAIGAEQSGYPWTIAEIDLYGHDNTQALDSGNAVVVAPDAPVPVLQAAADLAYYAAALTDSAFPVVAPAERDAFAGRVLRVETPAPLPADLSFEQLVCPEEYSVMQVDGEVVFSGQTDRAVLYAVGDFLHRHGVRWLYPAAHAEVVPRREKLDFSFLPLQGKPEAAIRYWNNGVRCGTDDQQYKWLIRNGFNGSWGTLQRNLGVWDRSSLLRSCWGSTHTMEQIWGHDVQKTHPEWFENTTHKAGWSVVPDVTAPGVVDFILQRAREEVAKRQERRRRAAEQGRPDPRPWYGFGVHPTDVESWAVSPRAEEMLGPFPKIYEGIDDSRAMAFDYSNLYGYLLDRVARRLQEEMPGKRVFGTAYSTTMNPPSKFERLPDNVVMIVCICAGAYNLPFSSPKNAWMREVLEGWPEKGVTPGIWDYILLDESKSRQPKPMLTAILERYAFIRNLGYVWLGTQGTEDPDNPWNVYAYARAVFRPTEDAQAVLGEFCAGYFREAAEPMTAYYRTLEDHFLDNDISLRRLDTMSFMMVFRREMYPPALIDTLDAHLDEAEGRARRWFVKDRLASIRESLEKTRERVESLPPPSQP